MGYFPGNIGQPKIAAVVLECQALMIDTHDVKEGGMKVMNGASIFNGVVSEFVSCTIAVAQCVFIGAPLEVKKTERKIRMANFAFTKGHVCPWVVWRQVCIGR